MLPRSRCDAARSFCSSRCPPPHATRLWCSDASDTGICGASTGVSEAEHRALWLWRPMRATQSKLATKLDLAIARHDPHGDINHAEERDAVRMEPERILAETFDFLELSCSELRPLSAAFRVEGMRCGPTIVFEQGGFWDLWSPLILDWIVWLILEDRVWNVHISLCDFGRDGSLWTRGVLLRCLLLRF